VKHWPALDVAEADDLVMAALDDFSPTASEDRDAGVRVFFSARENRDRAQAALADRGIAALPIDISDEDWAVRSQENLRPVTVGRITVVPAPEGLPPGQPADEDRASPIVIVIQPSMGFGTGHHATTRLCLDALQRTRVGGASLLDVGTGSGILAIAAARLGAAVALGIDVDADAVDSANENLALNRDVETVRFEIADVLQDPAAHLPRADIVTANLTGALLTRAATALVGRLNPGGTLILSGILGAEEPGVQQALVALDLEVAWRQQEEEWVCLMLLNRGILRLV
jgi:ribosomal protein L11 methyltransferase